MATDPNRSVPDRKEAKRLAWLSKHIPIGTILLGTLLVLGIVSAMAMMWGFGPASPIP
jgi:hypothetical protein